MSKRIDKNIQCAKALIENEELGLKQLAGRIGLSESSLQRQFTKAFGLSPSKYRQQIRLQRFKKELQAGQSVTAATYTAGYGSSSRVYERSSTVLGMSPAIYRKGGQGQVIHFATLATELGECLIAATERGICAILLESDDAGPRQQLQEEFPKATLIQQTEGVDSFLKQRIDPVAKLLSGKASSLPLDLVGTAFQVQVWEALMKIPQGQTQTYTDVARSIGRPNAHRAVARACAQNRLAVAVPCHRVIRSDGTLAGYRWGIDKKHQLLQREASNE